MPHPAAPEGILSSSASLDRITPASAPAAAAARIDWEDAISGMSVEPTLDRIEAAGHRAVPYALGFAALVMAGLLVAGL